MTLVMALWSSVIGHWSFAMPRILHVIPTLDRGGAEKQLALLAGGMKQRGWDVHVCCLTRGGPWQAVLDAASVPVHVIGQQWKLDPLAYSRLRRFIAELKPDLVHTWRTAANSYGRAAALSAGVKHVLATEGGSDSGKRTPQLLIDRWLTRWTEKTVTNSSAVADFHAGHGLPREKFIVIPNGVEPFEPGNDAVTRADLARELGLSPSTTLIGAIGRLEPQKRYKDLIWALDLLRCIHEDACLLIIGDGSQRWRLERYARQVTGPAVRFLGERSDVPRLLPHLSCFWLGSAHEGQSNALLEAMSAGLPAVVSDIPANREVVVDGETGFLVRLGDRAGFAGRTNELLKDPELGRRLGAAGRRRVEREFSVERMVEAYAALYRSLLDSKASTAATQ